GPIPLAPLRLQQLHHPAEGRHQRARAAPPRRAVLQPARLRPQAGVRGLTVRRLYPCWGTNDERKTLAAPRPRVTRAVLGGEIGQALATAPPRRGSPPPLSAPVR